MTVTARMVASVNPSTGDVVGEYAVDTDSQVDDAVARAYHAFAGWRNSTFEERAAALNAIADGLVADREELARSISLEMGKVAHEALAEVDKSASVCRYYAERAEEHLRTVPVESEWHATYVQHVPVGVVLAIMPWNYPVWQVMRAAAPALAAGNSVVLKHASNVTGCAQRIAALVRRAVPDRALLEHVVVPGTQVERLIHDPRIAAVSLTGSEAVGVQVAGACARALKKSVLELGGSDPFVVLEDADIEATARAAAAARFLNAGQSCIAAKRFIVLEAVAAEFEEAFAASAASLRYGDPFDDVDLGPLASVDARDEIAVQVKAGLRAGGRILVGGATPATPGAFYPPTVVAAVTPDNPLACEETFGPVAAVLRVADADAAIAVANASPYGLSASIWSADLSRAQHLAARLEAGSVFVNTPSVSDPRMPIGGMKRSGWGRELGAWGIKEFVNAQSVTVSG